MGHRWERVGVDENNDQFPCGFQSSPPTTIQGSPASTQLGACGPRRSVLPHARALAAPGAARAVPQRRARRLSRSWPARARLLHFQSSPPRRRFFAPGAVEKMKPFRAREASATASVGAHPLKRLEPRHFAPICRHLARCIAQNTKSSCPPAPRRWRP